ncbi:amino acid ABC transporter ATP-binding protein [Tissierella praeacuta]|uniref:amino acid ABC transporter ATP-binding protein n=1 Tax=Tissierella praeacuta TaxID=43131 RepID=UPI003341773F
MLKIEELYKSFGKSEILKGINLEVKKGETVALIGPSGTGKSTLLRCINYLEIPQKGIITLGDASVNAESAHKSQIKKIRSQSAMVFQNYNLFKNMTILENVMEPLVYVQKLSKAQAREEACGYLEQVGLSDKKEQYPSRISGGQQQRAAIARAMAVKPKIMLFDEPTSALDPELTGEVLSVIKKLAQNHSTMLIVTHEMNFAREAADRIVYMEDGYIIEQGVPEDILNHAKDERTRRFLGQS